MSPEQREKLAPQVKTVIFFVYDSKNSNVWLEERLDPDSAYFGQVIIPGGKVEETDFAATTAMEREIGEELGIEVTNGFFLDSFDDMSLSGNFRKCFAFLVTGFKGEVTNNEQEKGKSRLFSVPLDEAKRYLDLASSRYVIELARKKLGV